MNLGTLSQATQLGRGRTSASSHGFRPQGQPMLSPQWAAHSEYRSWLVQGPDLTLEYGDSLTAAFLPDVPGRTAWAIFTQRTAYSFSLMVCL